MAKYTSDNGNFLVATLQIKTLPSYRENLNYLVNYIRNSKANLIVAPELCLTNFDYEHFEEAADFYEEAISELLTLAPTKIIVFTITKKSDNAFVNQALVIYDNQIIHRQSKHKLFKLGNEEQYFKAGVEEEIVKFEINSVNYAILICFELRFKELWQRVEGADVIIVPARWGKSRKEHFETLGRALAIMNQCFVVLSDSADDDMASSSAIISPWGEVYADDTLESIEKNIELSDVKKVRRLISMV